MSIYVILDSEIHDEAEYEKYKQAVPALIAKHGGEYLARGGAIEVLAGDWHPERVVIFRWPSREALNAFMNDPEYQPWKKLRESVSTARALVMVEGA